MDEIHKPPLAVVGASARAAAFSAVRAGFAPLTADLFADADLVQCAQAIRIERYPHGLLEWLHTTPPDTVWLYTGALENHPDLVDEMAAVRPLIGCSGRVLGRVRDPLLLARLLAEADVAFPETRDARASDPPPPAPAWLLKSHRGSSGSGVRVWDGRRSRGSSDPLVLQRRIGGTPGSAVFVAGGGMATLLGTTRQLVGTPWTHAGVFQYAGSIGPWRLGDPAETELQRAGKLIAQAGVVGLFGVDFVLSDADGRPYVVEVNPRYTASVEIIERLIGRLPILSLHVMGSHFRRASSSQAPSEFASIAKKNVAAFGKAILFAPQDINVTQAFADWTRTKKTGPPWPELADLPHAGTSIPAGRPVLTVFAEGTSHAEVEQRLQERVGEVERRLVGVLRVPESAGA